MENTNRGCSNMTSSPGEAEGGLPMITRGKGGLANHDDIITEKKTSPKFKFAVAFGFFGLQPPPPTSKSLQF